MMIATGIRKSAESSSQVVAAEGGDEEEEAEGTSRKTIFWRKIAKGFYMMISSAWRCSEKSGCSSRSDVQR